MGVGIEGEANASESWDAVGDRKMSPMGDVKAPLGDEFLG